MHAPSQKTKYLDKIRDEKVKCKKYAARGTILALLRTIYNFAPWHSFLWIALSTVVFCLVGKFTVLAISRIIGYICSAIYDVTREINKFLNNKVINDVAKVGTTLVCKLEHNSKCLRYVSNHTENILPQIKLDQFRILMQLAHGQCKDFETAWAVLKYIVLLLAGADKICKDLEWYKSITLTRIFVFYPATSIFWVDSENNCDTSIATNVCAFAGTQLLFDFVLQDCVLPFVLLVGCWPLVKNFIRLLECEFLLLLYEAKYLLFKLHPSKRWKKKTTFCSRRRNHVVDDGDDDDVDSNGLSNI